MSRVTLPVARESARMPTRPRRSLARLPTAMPCRRRRAAVVEAPRPRPGWRRIGADDGRQPHEAGLRSGIGEHAALGVQLHHLHRHRLLIVVVVVEGAVKVPSISGAVEGVRVGLVADH